MQLLSIIGFERCILAFIKSSSFCFAILPLHVQVIHINDETNII